MGFTSTKVLNSVKTFYPLFLAHGEIWESVTFQDSTITFNSYLAMVAEAILCRICRYERDITRPVLEMEASNRPDQLDITMDREEILYWLYTIVSKRYNHQGLRATEIFRDRQRTIFEIGAVILHIVDYVKQHNNIPNTVHIKKDLRPIHIVHEERPEQVKVVRPVYLITDNIKNPRADMEMLTEVERRLKARGVKVIGKKIDIDGEFLAFHRIRTDMTVAKFQFNCAGTIRGYILEHFINLRRNRPFVYVNMSPRVKLKGLKWLPRAHDDNFSPRNFTGIANPYQKMRAANIIIDESRNYDHIANTIFNTVVKVQRTPVQPAPTPAPTPAPGQAPTPAPRVRRGGEGITGITEEIRSFLNQFTTTKGPIVYNVPTGMSDFLRPTSTPYHGLTAPVNAEWVRNIIRPFLERGLRKTALFKALGEHLFRNQTHQWYRNTRKGAVGAWRDRAANCVDTSHLAAAVFRTAGFPTAYIGKRRSDGLGHVWNMVYVNGGWVHVDVDWTSKRGPWFSDPRVHDNALARMPLRSFNRVWFNRRASINF